MCSRVYVCVCVWKEVWRCMTEELRCIIWMVGMVAEVAMHIAYSLVYVYQRKLCALYIESYPIEGIHPSLVSPGPTACVRATLDLVLLFFSSSTVSFLILIYTFIHSFFSLSLSLFRSYSFLFVFVYTHFHNEHAHEHEQQT